VREATIEGKREIMLDKLTPLGKHTTNVRCGLVRGNGERVVGCGKLDILPQYYYQNGGCTSTVSLCDNCAKDAMNPISPPDPEWHNHNITHDESVF
jgi:hypothetical protein